MEHREGVHLLPANIELPSMEVTLVNTMSRETVLRQYLSLVGKVNYFLGGKSLVIGWDSRWGRVEKVTVAGRDGSGNLQIIHCSSGHNNVVVAGSKGFTAIKHQREVGTSYFDAITTTIQGSQASTTALKNSTEDEQFFEKPKDELQVANG